MPSPSLSALAQYLTDGLREIERSRNGALRRHIHPKTRAISMTDIILHHYEISPYAEKVRLGLGLKGLAWGSVETPVLMPKPDLPALTGGYPKPPGFQIVADIYASTQLTLHQPHPRPPAPAFNP